MSEREGRSELNRSGAWTPAGAGRDGPRLPWLYTPYLVIMGLFGLRGAVQHLLPDAGSMRHAADGLQVLGWVLHVVWMHVVFTDAQRHLGPWLPVGPTLATVFAVVFGPFSYVWTGIAFVILAEAALRAGEDRAGIDALPPRFLVAAAKAPALVLASILWVSVHGVLVARGAGGDFVPRGQDAGVVDVLGPAGARMLSAFHVGMTAFYLLFVVRFFPGLYGSYRLLRTDGGPETMDSRT